MKPSASASAPGKVILLGEHSVVYAEPAISAAIDRRLAVSIRLAAGGSPRADAKCHAALVCAAGAFDLEPATLQIEISSRIPPACGLGSSAALSLALVRALADLTGAKLSDAEVLRRAGEVENVFHGTASGVDVAASASGGVVWFERPAPANAEPRVEPLALGRPFDLVIGLSGEVRSTAGPVSRLRLRHDRHPDLYGAFFRLAGDLVRAGRESLVRGDFDTLGSLMDAAQGLLNAFGVSTPTLERMVSIARAAGALGAKLSGAGGGGAMIALAPERGAAVAGALTAAGFEAFVTTIPAFPEEAQHARSSRRSA